VRWDTRHRHATACPPSIGRARDLAPCDYVDVHRTTNVNAYTGNVRRNTNVSVNRDVDIDG